MIVHSTNRGFKRINFKDRYQNECSLQKSSIATEECIWFGANGDRMHLTQGDVRELLPFLQHFVETGEL